MGTGTILGAVWVCDTDLSLTLPSRSSPHPSSSPTGIGSPGLSWILPGTLCRSAEVSQCCLLRGTLCSKLSCLCPPGLALLLNHTVCWTPTGTLSSCLKALRAASWGNRRLHSIAFSSLRDHCSIVWSWQCIFHTFCPFFCLFDREQRLLSYVYLF